MLLNAYTVLLVLSFISFAAAAIGVPASRVNLIGLGLALYVLALLVH